MYRLHLPTFDMERKSAEGHLSEVFIKISENIGQTNIQRSREEEQQQQEEKKLIQNDRDKSNNRVGTCDYHCVRV